MANRIKAGRVILDWQRLLGFDQAAAADNVASATTLSPKIGPKEARGFGDCASTLAAKVGQKPDVIHQGGSFGSHLHARVGVKSDMRFGDNLPISVTAKIGFKPS